MYKFEISWKYGYNDYGASFVIEKYKINPGYDDELIDSESVVIREHEQTPKNNHGWKKALTDIVRDNPNMRGAISAIRKVGKGKNPYYYGSEDPHWMR